MKRRKKIFFILTKDPSHIQGNTEKYYLSKFLTEHSSFHVFAPLSDPIAGTTNHSLPVKGVTGAIYLNIFLIPYWIYHFYTEQPDIIYCYQNVILPALLGRYVFDAEVAFDLRSDPYEQTQEFFKDDERRALFKIAMRIAKSLHTVILKRADHVFILSESLTELIVSNYGVDREVIHLLPLGVDTERFVPIEDPYDDRLSIVYVGSLARYRGIDLLLEAVGDLSPEIQEQVRVDLYGNGPEEYLSELVSRTSYGNPLEIYWHGLVPHEELPKRAGRSDIAVSPIPPYEAYQVSSPAKVFEYLALGLPIVASQIEPHERILDDGKDGILYEPESANDLRDKLERLILEKQSRNQMSENARSKALQFSWEQRFSIVKESLGLEC